MAFSKIIVEGRLTKDPVARDVNAGGQTKKVCNFTVAVDRDFGSEGADFYDVVVWERTAENVLKYLSKGSNVLVEGRHQRRTYTATTPGGEEYGRDVWEIQNARVVFIGGNNSRQGGGNQGTTQYGSSQQSSSQPFQNTYQPSDDDLPF